MSLPKISALLIATVLLAATASSAILLSAPAHAQVTPAGQDESPVSALAPHFSWVLIDGGAVVARSAPLAAASTSQSFNLDPTTPPRFARIPSADRVKVRPFLMPELSHPNAPVLRVAVSFTDLAIKTLFIPGAGPDGVAQLPKVHITNLVVDAKFSIAKPTLEIPLVSSAVAADGSTLPPRILQVTWDEGARKSSSEKN